MGYLMRKIPVKIKWLMIISVAIILIGQIPLNLYKVKPVINNNNQFLSSMMSGDSMKLLEFSMSYPGKEQFFMEKLKKIDSTFGIVKKYEMVKVRKDFSNAYFTTYQVDFDRTNGCTAIFEIHGDPNALAHFRLGEVDIMKDETKQYVSVRPLRDRL
jgi:hypothetical protein